MPTLFDAYGRPITPDPNGWRECGISDTTGGTYYVRGEMSDPGPPPAPPALILDAPGWYGVEDVVLVYPAPGPADTSHPR